MKLTKDIILQALARLGELAHGEGLELHICIYGGAAMILAYDSRMVSKDVDVILHPSEQGLALARQVGDELGLHRKWLNDEVRHFVSEERDRSSRRHLDLPIETKGLKVEVPTANYLLAMKARACREPIPGISVDEADLRFLIRKMEIRTIQEVEILLEKYFPKDPLGRTLETLSGALLRKKTDERKKEKDQTAGNPCGCSD